MVRILGTGRSSHLSIANLQRTIPCKSEAPYALFKNKFHRQQGTPTYEVSRFVQFVHFQSIYSSTLFIL